MRRLWALFGIAIATVLQTALVPEMRIQRFAIGPDFLLLMACLAGLYAAPGDAVLAGWLCGLSKDVFSAGAMGANAFIFALCSYTLVRHRRDLFKDHPLTQIGVVTVCGLFCELIAGLWLADTRAVTLFLADAVRVALRGGASALYGAFLAPFVFPVAVHWLSMAGRMAARRGG